MQFNHYSQQPRFCPEVEILTDIFWLAWSTHTVYRAIYQFKTTGESGAVVAGPWEDLLCHKETEAIVSKELGFRWKC